MDASPIAVDINDTGEQDAFSENICLDDILSLSSNGNAAEILTRVELDVAYSSEKLLNLEIFLMQVSARENVSELLAVDDNNNTSEDSSEKWLEFDLLSAILEAEMNELNTFMITLQTEITDAHHKNTSREAYIEIQEKLHDSQQILERSQNQLREMKMQFANLQSTLSILNGQVNCNDIDMNASEKSLLSHKDTNLKMQTVEQQKHILRMLEKSLERELDMEKRLYESRNSEEELRRKLHCAEQKLFWMEEESEFVFGRLFEAENAAESLMGISKGLTGRLQVLQFNLNGLVQRDSDMRLQLQSNTDQIEKIHSLEDQLKESESDLQKAKACIEEIQEQKKILSSKIGNLEDTIDELKGKIAKEENVELLEKNLSESNLQLQHAKASAEASQEKQNLLYSTIDDMESVIEDLKSRVLKAENAVLKVETKCTLLSETNLEINEELTLLRSRNEFLEMSLNQADDEKIITAKDISIKTKAISELVPRLSRERERLQKQVSSLSKENKNLAAKLDKQPAETTEHISKDDPTTFTNTFEEVLVQSSSNIQVDKLSKDSPAIASEAISVSSTEMNTVRVSDVGGTVRTIDAWQLSKKYYLFPVLVLFVSATVYLIQLEKCPF